MFSLKEGFRRLLPAFSKESLQNQSAQPIGDFDQALTDFLNTSGKKVFELRGGTWVPSLEWWGEIPHADLVGGFMKGKLNLPDVIVNHLKRKPTVWCYVKQDPQKPETSYRLELNDLSLRREQSGISASCNLTSDKPLVIHMHYNGHGATDWQQMAHLTINTAKTYLAEKKST
ncbi:MAG: hypothetical protein Q8P89_01190 [bacterium]|nr:hypothetical protein [bacterium]